MTEKIKELFAREHERIARELNDMFFPNGREAYYQDFCHKFGLESDD